MNTTTATAMVKDNGKLTTGSYIMSMEASERWGAWAAEGVEADDLGTFRRSLRVALARVAAARGRDIEVYAQQEGAQSWMVGVVKAL